MRIDFDKQGRVRIELDSVMDKHSGEELTDVDSGMYTTWIFLSPAVADELATRIQQSLFERDMGRMMA